MDDSKKKGLDSTNWAMNSVFLLPEKNVLELNIY